LLITIMRLIVMASNLEEEYAMKPLKILFISALALFVVSSTAIAKDFGWTRNFNKEAKADPPEFRARLAARFDLTDVQVIALRNIFASPADAYIMLRLGEMQGGLNKISKEQAVEAVNKYRINKDKGWEALAESLGVETESKEFVDLKRNHDLQAANKQDQVAFSGYGSAKDSF
jgi:hypothetical protein